jgi:four helix bundle protein
MNPQELKARSKQFARRVMTMTDALPHNAKRRPLGEQILRSSTSGASDYRAARRARSRADWIGKTGRILEEADESLLWLEPIDEGRLPPARPLAALKQEAAELTMLFASIHKSSKS